LGFIAWGFFFRSSTEGAKRRNSDLSKRREKHPRFRVVPFGHGPNNAQGEPRCPRGPTENHGTSSSPPPHLPPSPDRSTGLPDKGKREREREERRGERGESLPPLLPFPPFLAPREREKKGLCLPLFLASREREGKDRCIAFGVSSFRRDEGRLSWASKCSGTQTWDSTCSPRFHRQA